MRDFKKFIEIYEKVPYKNIDSAELSIYHHRDFDLWFDKELFDWNDCLYLCSYCSEHFDKWFDKDLFNWMYSNYLFRDCLEHLTDELIWECKDKIEWKYINSNKFSNSLQTKLKIAGYL